MNNIDEVEKDLQELNASKSWEDRLTKVAKGRGMFALDHSVSNYVLYLENHPKYKGKFKYNEYTKEYEFDGKPYTDAVDSYISDDIEKYFYSCKRQVRDDAVRIVLDKNKYNPVHDYINGLVWDGKPRIETLFIDLLEADDTELNREMSRKWLIAAVKRTLEPGCKFDNMIVLKGGQGIGKSTICDRLAKGFSSSISLSEIDNKDIVSKINRTWIGIIDEMDAFGKKDMNTIKTFLSQNDDKVRLPYERYTQEFKRHCVFIGSTNDTVFLRDTTSSVERRFWVIDCKKTTRDGKVYETMTDEFVDQVWAEAYSYYKQDPYQYLDIDQSKMDEFAEAQKDSKIVNEDLYIEELLFLLDTKKCNNKNGEVWDISQIEGISYGEGYDYPINKIRTPVVKELMEKKFRDSRSTQYIMQGIGDKWVHKNIGYKSVGCKTYKSFVRKDAVEYEVKKSVYDEFLVGLGMKNE